MINVNYDIPSHVAKRLSVTESGCWQWSGSTQEGYAATTYNGARWLVHRLMYTLCGREIPDGMVIDHLCRNRACANPDHLEPVTIAENVKRGTRATQTHCKRGHEFTPENTSYYRPTKGGGVSRRCLACRRAWHAARAQAEGRIMRASKYRPKEKK